MSNQPLVSVIIIFLNAEQFIQEAIESVFAQTYAAWELLLVDDGIRFVSNLRGVEPDAVHNGMEVALSIEDVDGVVLPQFRAVGDAP